MFLDRDTYSCMCEPVEFVHVRAAPFLSRAPARVFRWAGLLGHGAQR